MQEKMRTTEKAQKNEVPGHGRARGARRLRHIESYWDQYDQAICWKRRCVKQRENVQNVGMGVK